MTHSLIRMIKKSSPWGRILFGIVMILVICGLLKTVFPKKEGFEKKDEFLFKSGGDVYDGFYANIYDHLVYNQMKDNFEIGEIVNVTTPTEQSVILDIGSATGKHVDALSKKNLKVIGIDISPSMVATAKTNYPNLDFVEGDALNASNFQPASFTHILCLYHTIYYMKDKTQFFNNCMNWLMPGGYLVLHLVNRDMFDPILPSANPLVLFTPQKYAEKRITTSNIIFNNFKYSSNYELHPEKNQANFVEKFKDKKTGKIFRKNEHTLYVEPEGEILSTAQYAGFILHGQVDMIKCGYEYNTLYFLVKPE